MTATTCAFGAINSSYQLIGMCSVLKVLSDLSTFINDAFSPLIQLMVLVIVLGAVLSIVGAILYTVFKAIQGSFGGW